MMILVTEFINGGLNNRFMFDELDGGIKQHK
jgi:hypothetical protein